MKRLCAVSVDLDEIPHYYAIHGLSPRPGPGSTAVYDTALGRLDELSRHEGVPLTLFAVGADLKRPESAQALRAMAAAGHEMGNHTLDHRYDLTRLSRDAIEAQVRGGIDAIEEATGERPEGFRAPGYTVTDTLFDVLDACGAAYDSSVFPCPPYYLAKAGVMGLIRLRGRRSRSVLDRPSVLLSPTTPYRVGRPYRRRGSGLLELPIQVTRGLRLPYIGTTVTLAGPRRARLLTRMVLGEPFVNLELHGIDVLDGRDGFEDLVRHQVDARVRHEEKLEALSAAIAVLRKAGYSFVRLDEAARQFQRRT